MPLSETAISMAAVDDGHSRFRRDINPKVDIFTERPSQERREACQQGADIGRLGIEGLSSSESQQLRRELGAVVGCALRLTDEFALIRSGKVRDDEFEVGDGRGQDIVEFVGDPAGKLSDRLHLLGLDQPLLRHLPDCDLRLDTLLQRLVQAPQFPLSRFRLAMKRPLVLGHRPAQGREFEVASHTANCSRDANGLIR